MDSNGRAFRQKWKTLLSLRAHYFSILSPRDSIQSFNESQDFGLQHVKAVFWCDLRSLRYGSLSFMIFWKTPYPNVRSRWWRHPLWLLSGEIILKNSQTNLSFAHTFHSIPIYYISKRSYFCWLSENKTCFAVWLLLFCQISPELRECRYSGYILQWQRTIEEVFGKDKV